MFKKMKKCPYCNEKVKEDINICPFCGENISETNENTNLRNKKKSFSKKL